MNTLTIPKAPARIVTYKPQGGGNNHAVEIAINVTAKNLDDAVEALFPGYKHKVSAMAQAESPSCEERIRRSLGEINLRADSGGDQPEKVIDWVGAETKAPRLVISAKGEAAELRVVVVGPLPSVELGTVAVYRGADIFVEIEPHQLDIEDETKKAKRTRRRKKKEDAAATQMSMPTGSIAVETADASDGEGEDADGAGCTEDGATTDGFTADDVAH
jgi:acylphosphatase